MASSIGNLITEGRKKLIYVEANATMRDCLNCMIEHNVRMVPVVDKKRAYCLGMVTCFDILAAVCHHEYFQTTIFTDVDTEIHHNIKEEFLSQPAQQFLGSGGYEGVAIRTFPSDAPVSDLVQYFASGSHVSIVTHGKDSYLVTQTDVVRHAVHSNSSVLTTSLQDLKLPPKKPRSVSEEISALEAFRIMYAERYTGLAVINGQGEIVGHISSTDVRSSIVGEQLSRLLLPVRQFLASSVAAMTHPVVTCTASAKLGEAASLMLENKVHRVYVVDDHHKPVSVVTMTDFMRVWSKHATHCAYGCSDHQK
eukprot:Rmarinus@m.4901